MSFLPPNLQRHSTNSSADATVIHHPAVRHAYVQENIGNLQQTWKMLYDNL